MNVYTWMLLTAMFCLTLSIILIRAELRETYELEGMPKIFGIGDGMTAVKGK
jgi:hypothetical protein